MCGRGLRALPGRHSTLTLSAAASRRHVVDAPLLFVGFVRKKTQPSSHVGEVFKREITQTRGKLDHSFCVFFSFLRAYKTNDQRNFEIKLATGFSITGLSTKRWLWFSGSGQNLLPALVGTSRAWVLRTWSGFHRKASLFEVLFLRRLLPCPAIPAPHRALLLNDLRFSPKVQVQNTPLCCLVALI